MRFPNAYLRIIVLILGLTSMTQPQSPAYNLGNGFVAPDGKLEAKPEDRVLNFNETATQKQVSQIELSDPLPWDSATCWKPDSSEFLYSNRRGLHIVTVLTGKSRDLFGLQPQFMMPAWSPDSKFIACLGSSPSPGRYLNTLKIWDAASGTEFAIYKDELGNRLVWSPNNKRIAIIDKNWLVKLFDLDTKSIVTTIQAERAGLPLVTWSPDSKYITVGNGMTGEVCIFEATTGRYLTSHEFKHHGAIDIEWTKDGSIKVQKDLNGKEWEPWVVPYEQHSRLIVRTPRIERKLGSPGYIPATLDECFTQLDSELKPDQIEKLTNGTEQSLSLYHIGFGTGLRNRWGLWSGSRLAKYFNQKGIFHPDDMSGIIIKSYWRHKNSKPLELDQQIEFYKAYWTKAKADHEAAKAKEKADAEKIAKLMMNLTLKEGPCQTLNVEPPAGRGIALRAANKISEDKLLLLEERFVTSKLKEGGAIVNDTATACLIFDAKSKTIYRPKTLELDTVTGGAALNGSTYLVGRQREKPTVLEVRKSSRKVISLPKAAEWDPDRYRQRDSSQYKPTSIIDPYIKRAVQVDFSQDGWNILGYGGNKVLLIQPKAVYELNNGAWKRLFETKQLLPKCSVPPILLGERLYFLDPEYGICWLNQNNPDKLIFLTADAHLGEGKLLNKFNAQSFSPTEDGSFWQTSGTFGQNSVLKWSKAHGYEIGILDNRLSCDYNPDVSEETPPPITTQDDLVFNSIFAIDQDQAICAGAKGLYKIEGKAIRPLVKFKTGSPIVKKDPVGFISSRPCWEPSFLYVLDDSTYLLGGTTQGCYLLTKDKNGVWSMEQLDDKEIQEKPL